ncbi:uncharacterized protein N7498_009948 [Penicillium cinerascens]|uniref:MARVEL domain-containing protein n=1 Tax=Penicillium cinerascens TaxID=70096 RepID=A0A9W9J5I4_9EURO|nr:uncharacterized protein N7498_009948 [Penicillium cinerascens]KAJ5190963.1 hypothetical protein N7498_009948 [Penicillium cinerascens]
MDNFFSHPTGLVAWIARLLQYISSIILIGITGWAVRHTKSVTVIYTLVIAILTLVILPFAILTSCISRRHKWHVLPLVAIDGILSYLWLTSAIFLALDFNQHNCRRTRWNGEIVCSRQYAAEAFSFIALQVISYFVTLMALVVELAYIYSVKPGTAPVMEEVRPEQRIEQNLTAAGVL